ncbi:uncharacterized protein [Haliotis cracherodii]|uniref:uncharacterized protein n=1 Tax=Haliotis cracherodii TaxID=6455 RepID=UPI0039EB6AEC
MGALQRVEAVAFAVREVNSREDILPNVTLGFTMMDDCSKDTTALVRALHLIQNNGASNISIKTQLQPINVIGVIGSESSKNSVQIADLLSLFKIPVLSYLSTSPLLSNKFVYPYFSRIVPSDTLQAKVIVDILKTFGWTYVSIVYAEGSYGSEGYKAVKAQVEEIRYCLACEICPSKTNYTWPDFEMRTQCYPIEHTYTGMHDFTGIVIVTVDIFTVFVTILVTFFYIKNNEEKLIKASSRELSYLMLGGIFLSCVFTLIIGIWIILDTPRALTAMPSFSERYVEVTCKLPETGFLVSVVCNLTLVLVCTFYAMKTRKLPDNFNESRFVSFCVYTTIVLWLAFIPTYFTTTKTTLRSLFLAAAMAANSNVILFFLYVPKLYALYYLSTEAQNLAMGTSMPVATSSRSQGVGINKVMPGRT